jgi:hypothetical protein
MTGQKRDKLNQLPRLLPEGAVAEAAWLEARGYPRSLRKHYLDRGWLASPGRGLFTRPGPPLRWESVVYSLQSVMAYPVLVGGRTALELEGFAHYPRAEGPAEVHLYTEEKPPAWLDRLPLEARFVRRAASRLFPEGALAAELDRARGGERPAAGGSVQAHVWGPSHQPILISAPERAVLELLDELPGRETFEQVDALFDGLTSLRPQRLQALLVACRSVKVKRLFFWFARRRRHAWLSRLDESAVDFGSGKRALVPGGKLDPRYLITVPEAMHGDR